MVTIMEKMEESLIKRLILKNVHHNLRKNTFMSTRKQQEHPYQNGLHGVNGVEQIVPLQKLIVMIMI